MNEQIQWHKDLDVGHDRIDFEHKVFLALIKNISLAAADKPRRQLNRMLCELERYAAFHFFSEENIALENGESDKEVGIHQRIHQYLLDELRRKIQRHEDGTEETDTIVAFLVDWFGLHAEQDRERVARFAAESTDTPKSQTEPPNS